MVDDTALTTTRKADFSQLYSQPDPRAYVRTLHELDYQIPQRALPVFDALLDAQAGSGRPQTVLDVCCSYGINAASLRCRVDLDDLSTRYADPALDALAGEELTRSDADFYAGRLVRPEVSVLGLDVSRPAIDYGVGAGLLRAGWAEDLEAADPSPELVAGIGDVGLLICTGGVGYIGMATFDRLLRALPAPQDLWMAVFVLRVFDYTEIAASFEQHGLVTEELPGRTFRQRRFADQQEHDAANDDVARRGLDPAGMEADGWYHATCYVTRPKAAAQDRPVTDLLGQLA